MHKNLIKKVAIFASLALVFIVSFLLIPKTRYDITKEEATLRSVDGLVYNYEVKDTYLKRPITTIGVKAFKDSLTLKTVRLGQNIEYIERLAFAGCKNLYEFEFNQNIKGIDNNMFKDCISLEKVSFGADSELRMIGGSMFFNCKNLSNIEIPEKVTHIYTYAFFGCVSLTEITIPESVIHIYNDVFFGCDNLKKIIINGEPVLDDDWLNGTPADIVVEYNIK